MTLQQRAQAVSSAGCAKIKSEFEMNISKRLMLTLVVALVALVFVGSLGLWRLGQAQDRFEYVQVNILPSISELSGARDDLGAMRRLAYRYGLEASSSARDQLAQRMAAADKSFDKHMDVYEKDDISDDHDRQLLQTDMADMATYRQTRRQFIDKYAAGDAAGAMAMVTGSGILVKQGDAVDADLKQHAAYNTKLSDDLRTENNASFSSARWILIGSIVLALLVTAVLGLNIYRLINSGLGRLQGALQHVAESLDLTHTVHVDRMDEIGHTATAFNRLLGRVGDVIGEVRMAAGSVSTASKEIAAGNTDLSGRTEEQAASLEQTAASMEELTTTVKHNADNARQASSLAISASEISDQGSQVVERMMHTMGDISSSASKIAEITTLIEGIAFQTNILALNAAVEAARAGEQGRGFAVVAAEVRNLAQRSSSAAKEIKDLIDHSVSTIRDGSEQAVEVGRTNGQARDAVKRVVDIIGEIASASDEQGRGIEQVNQAVSQMDEVTQQNAALVEEAAAAAQSLDEQAMRLNQMVSAFTVSTDRSAPRTEAPASVSAAPQPRVAAAARDVKPRKSITLSKPFTASVAVAGAADWETF